MRSNISAQSCASVPPAPAWMSRNALCESILPANMRRNSSSSSSLVTVCDLADDVAERARVLFLARELVELAGFVERLLDAVQRRDDGLELGALAA